MRVIQFLKIHGSGALSSDHRKILNFWDSTFLNYAYELIPKISYNFPMVRRFNSRAMNFEKLNHPHPTLNRQNWSWRTKHFYTFLVLQVVFATILLTQLNAWESKGLFARFTEQSVSPWSVVIQPHQRTWPKQFLWNRHNSICIIHCISFTFTLSGAFFLSLSYKGLVFSWLSWNNRVLLWIPHHGKSSLICQCQQHAAHFIDTWKAFILFYGYWVPLLNLWRGSRSAYMGPREL